MNRRPTLLVVDDRPETLALLVATLAADGYRVRTAGSGEQALAALAEELPDLVLLKIHLPGIGGLEVCRRIVGGKTTRRIPIIVMSAPADSTEVVAALRLGAVDYVSQLLQPEELLARVATRIAIEETSLCFEEQAAILAETTRRLEAELQERKAMEAELIRSAGQAERTRKAMLSTMEDLNRTSAALRDSERYYRSIFQNNPLPMWVYDRETFRFLSVNKAAIEHYGYSEAEFLAMTLMDIRPPEEVPRVARALAELPVGAGIVEVWKHRKKSGELIDVEISADSVISGGRPARLVLAHDITERRRAEAERERLMAAIEQASEAIVITDSRATIQYVNPAFTASTGYSREEAAGQNPRFLKSGKQDSSFYRTMWQTISGGKSWFGRMVNRRRNGELFTEEASISPVRDRAGEITNFVAVKRDISAHLHLVEQFQQAQKMDAVGRLAGGIAHDFNNILQAISLQAAVMRRRAGSPEIAGLAEEIAGNIRRGADLTRQLLLYSRRQPVEKKIIEIGEIVGTATVLLRRLIPENIRLTVDTTAARAMLLGDSGQIQQVLMNLAINARDAMENGGTLTVRTGSRDGEVVVDVMDTGHGMDEETRAHLFEPFFTTKVAGRGTGLGLAVVHSIVLDHGGRIEVESAPGEGSRFRVLLPEATEPEERDESAMPGEELRGRGERVLVVEDEEGARTGLVELLTMLNFRVTAVGSGEEAEALPAEPPPDLLLTDLMLPGISGPQVVKRLSKRWPAMKVVLMSGYTDDTAVRRDIDERKVLFLQKPFEVAPLSQALRAALDGPRRKTDEP